MALDRNHHLRRRDHDVTLKGLHLQVFAKHGLFSLGPNLVVADAKVTIPAGVQNAEMIRVDERTSFTRVRFSGLDSPKTSGCIVARYTTIKVTDSSFEGCRVAVQPTYETITNVANSVFNANLIGIRNVGGLALTTTD